MRVNLGAKPVSVYTFPSDEKEKEIWIKSIPEIFGAIPFVVCAGLTILDQLVL